MSENHQQSEDHAIQTAAPLLCAIRDGDCQCVSDLRRLRQEVSYLEQQVRTDALTGLFNFRYMTEILPLEMERTRRSGQTMSLILLDIDHFKQFNDQWGHELGNQALIHVAQLVSSTLRQLDMPCRFGGEEFVLILPNTDLIQAVGVAERLRERIATSALRNSTDEIAITASLGVDEFKLQHQDTPEKLLRRVDAWLYHAKDSGRNRVSHPELAAEVAAVTSAEKAALFGWENDL